MSRVSLDSIKSMTLSYAIGMWYKRQEYNIKEPVQIQVAHIRTRFDSPLWSRRIQSVFQDLSDTHPHFSFTSTGVLEYSPILK
jgi:hypothetical protein